MTPQYNSLREKIAAEKAERLARYAEYETLWQRALDAGRQAGEAITPRPMVVARHANVLDDRSAVVEAWHVPDGVCGFAWIVTPKGTTSFARWATKHKQARKEYGGGTCLYWVHEFNQSMARKEAFAQAFARVLQEAGIPAYAQSRMD